MNAGEKIGLIFVIIAIIYVPQMAGGNQKMFCGLLFLGVVGYVMFLHRPEARR